MNIQSSLKRGDVVLTKFPFSDLSGSKLRPAIIVSSGLIGRDVVLIGISSVLRRLSLTSDYFLGIPHPEFKLTGLRVASVIRGHKLALVDYQFVVRRLGRIGPQLESEVDQLLR